MASFTLNCVGTFPDGTSVGAYPLTNWPGRVRQDAAPPGSATNSQTVAAESVTFTGLSTQTTYVAYGLVGSTHRYTQFYVGPEPNRVPDGSLESADFPDNTLAPSKLANQTAGKILQANSSGVVTGTAVTGDVTISNSGVTAIGATKVTSGMLAGSIVLSKLTQPDVGTYFRNPTLNPSSTAGTTLYQWIAPVVIPWGATLTGIAYYAGATATGKARSAIYDSTGATRLANRTTDFTISGVNAFQKVAFDSTYAAPAGLYWMSLMWDTTGTTFFGSGSIGPSSFVLQASFVTPSSITVPTTAGITPVMTTY